MQRARNNHDYTVCEPSRCLVSFHIGMYCVRDIYRRQLISLAFVALDSKSLSIPRKNIGRFLFFPVCSTVSNQRAAEFEWSWLAFEAVAFDRNAYGRSLLREQRGFANPRRIIRRVIRRARHIPTIKKPDLRKDTAEIDFAEILRGLT